VPAVRTADVLHFAGHGRTDLIDPERSALWLHNAAAHRAAVAGEDPLAAMAASIDDGWREARVGLREVVIAGGGLLAEYDDGSGELERRLEHPLGSTVWSRGSRTAERWTAEEITVGDTFPRCRLAVLTACEAAGAGATPTDEATGLPAALTTAGVGTVVASMWPVDDDFAVVFADRFYRALTKRRPSGRIDIAELVDVIESELRTMSSTEVVDLLSELIRLTSDRAARARLLAARATRAAGPAAPFADAVHWAAFTVHGSGLVATGDR
jgi:CHAT domain-containing protein